MDRFSKILPVHQENKNLILADKTWLRKENKYDWLKKNCLIRSRSIWADKLMIINTWVETSVVSTLPVKTSRVSSVRKMRPWELAHTEDSPFRAQMMENNRPLMSHNRRHRYSNKERHNHLCESPSLIYNLLWLRCKT